MSVKQVTCPQCQTVMNVVASMASVQCQTCGQVFQTSGPQPSAANRAAVAAPDSQEEDDESKMVMWTIIGGIGAVVLFGVAIVAAFAFVGDGADARARAEAEKAERAEERKKQMAADAAPYLPEIKGSSYEEVTKLAESTRQRIYREHVAMIESSFGKATKVPKGGAIGKGLQSTLGGIIEREIESQSIAYNITKEEYANIVAEGEAKEW